MANQAVTSADTSSNIALVGRQSIYNRKLDVFGYELLYRPSESVNAAHGDIDGSVATGEVMLNTFFELGLEKIVGSNLAFINLTQDYIEGNIPIAFSGKSVVLEILENIEVTDSVISGVERLKSEGYTIALDDYIFEAHLLPLVPHVDIIKIDIMALSSDALKQGLKQLKKDFGGKLLAEKIETFDEFELCKSLGFDLFQGYFLEKPVIIKGTKMPSNKVSILYLLSRLQDQEVEFDELESLIKKDPSLSFKLLRYINSPSFNLDAEITSIKQAVMLLGMTTLKRWVTLIVLAGVSDKSPELIEKSLSRAYMCEQLSIALKKDNQDQYFIVGLFSVLDAMLDQEQSELLKQTPLHENIKQAILMRKGTLGKVLKCVIAYEHGDWLNAKCGSVPMSEIQNKYLESIAWAKEQLSGMNS